MATLALRIPTTGPDGSTVIIGGHCYIIFPDPYITVGELISEKVRAELRKARAGGAHTSSLPYLLTGITSVGHGPLDEQLAISEATKNYQRGDYQLWVDGAPIYNKLDDVIGLTQRTRLAFVITEPLPASAYNVPQSQREGWLDRKVMENKTTNNYERRYHWTVGVSADRERYLVVSIDTQEHTVLIYRAVDYISEGYDYYCANADMEITTWVGRKE